MTVPVRDFYGMTPTSGQHPEVTLTAPNGEPVRVDVSIAALHLALWDAGVVTLASCGGDGSRRAYILFDTEADVRAAVPILAVFHPHVPEYVTEMIDVVADSAPASRFDDFVTVSVDEWKLLRNFDVGGIASWKWAMYFPAMPPVI